MLDPSLGENYDHEEMERIANTRKEIDCGDKEKCQTGPDGIVTVLIVLFAFGLVFNGMYGEHVLL